VPRFEVKFRTAPAPAAAIDAALEAAGIEHIADYGSSPPSGSDDYLELPDPDYKPDTHVVSLVAENADSACRAAAEAIEGEAAGFELVSVTPQPQPAPDRRP
jgi:hypothetical protein